MPQRVTSPEFIGRGPELAALLDALEGAADSRFCAVFVAGESGIGKSRLLQELERAAQERGARILAGECISLAEGGLPYAPIRSALRNLERGADGAAPDELARLLPELGAAGSQARLFELLLALLSRLASQAPLVLMIEDVRWADRSTLDLLAFLLANARHDPLLLVCSYRTDELDRRHPLRAFLAQHERPPAVQRVELHPFTPAELEAQLHGILGTAPDPALAARPHQRTEGSAFFTEELLAASRDATELPASLREALMLRIDALPEPLARVRPARGRAHAPAPGAGRGDRGRPDDDRPRRPRRRRAVRALARCAPVSGGARRRRGGRARGGADLRVRRGRRSLPPGDRAVAARRGRRAARRHGPRRAPRARRGDLAPCRRQRRAQARPRRDRHGRHRPGPGPRRAAARAPGPLHVDVLGRQRGGAARLRGGGRPAAARRAAARAGTGARHAGPDSDVARAYCRVAGALRAGDRDRAGDRRPRRGSPRAERAGRESGLPRRAPSGHRAPARVAAPQPEAARHRQRRPRLREPRRDARPGHAVRRVDRARARRRTAHRRARHARLPPAAGGRGGDAALQARPPRRCGRRDAGRARAADLVRPAGPVRGARPGRDPARAAGGGRAAAARGRGGDADGARHLDRAAGQRARRGRAAARVPGGGAAAGRAQPRAGRLHRLHRAPARARRASRGRAGRARPETSRPRAPPPIARAGWWDGSTARSIPSAGRDRRRPSRSSIARRARPRPLAPPAPPARRTGPPWPSAGPSWDSGSRSPTRGCAKPRPTCLWGSARRPRRHLPPAGGSRTNAARAGWPTSSTRSRGAVAWRRRAGRPTLPTGST